MSNLNVRFHPTAKDGSQSLASVGFPAHRIVKEMISMRFAEETAKVICERLDEAYELWVHHNKIKKEASDYATALRIIEEYEKSKPTLFGIPPLKYFCREKQRLNGDATLYE